MARYGEPTRRWIRPAIAIVIGTTVIAMARPLYILGVVFGIWQPLARPHDVTPAARYVSWIEDGAWFDCAVDSRRDVDVRKAWDSDGRLIASGHFRLECLGRAAAKAELRPSSVNSSGGHAYAIYLFGENGARSRTLVPVTSEGQNPCPQVTITYPGSQ